MRSSVEITQNTRRWQTGLGVTGNQQGKMLRSQILEHLQTRQSSENLQIDCIPVPRSRCRCRKGSNASSQQPTSKEIWNLLECKFCTFLKATLGISTDIEHWTKVFQPSMRPFKSARILNSCQISCSLSIISLRSGRQLRAGNAKQLALEDTVWFLRADRGTSKWFSHVQCFIWELIKNASTLSHFVAHHAGNP